METSPIELTDPSSDHEEKSQLEFELEGPNSGDTSLTLQLLTNKSESRPRLNTAERVSISYSSITQLASSIAI